MGPLPDLAPLLVLAAASLAGAAIQAATGFGFAIVAAPFFLGLLNSSSAITVLVLLHIVQTAIMVPGLWREAPRRLLVLLVAGGLVGCLIGLAVFRYLDVKALKLAIGAAIIVATALLVLRESGALSRLVHPPRDGRPHVWPGVTTGIASGLMTSILVMPGPPLMLLMAAEPHPKAETRALSLTFFGLCYVFVSSLHAATGLLDKGVLALVAVLAPAVWLGTVLGTRASVHFTEARFRVAVLALLVLSGIGALASALLG